MLGRDWLHTLTLGITLALVGQGLGQAQSCQNVQPAKEQAQTIPKQHPTSSAPIAPDQTAESDRPTLYEPDCRAPKSRDDVGLCEERRMAKAAEDSAEWSRQSVEFAENQFYATIGEIVALVVTIGVGVAAVVAAFRANNMSRTSGERQLRAYLGVITARIEWSDGRPKALFKVKNAGQTPAYGFTNKINGSFGEPAAYDFDENDNYFPRFDLLPGDDINMHFTFTEDLTWEQFLQTGRTLYVWGQVDYKDTFDRDQSTEFRYRSGDEIKPGTLRLRPTPEGNRST